MRAGTQPLAGRAARLLGGGLVVVVMLTGSRPAATAAPRGRTLAQVLEAHCRAREATSTLTARFVETKVIASVDETDSSSGVLSYRKPDAVRWQYFSPDSSWTVLRGEQGWSVFPHIRQVQKFTLRGSRADRVLSTVGFGSCGPGLEQAFEISLSMALDGSYVLSMIPKTPELAASFSRLELTLDAQDYLPRRVAMHEVSGDTVRFDFRDLRRNSRLESKLFEYEVPKGYEVVE